ncbi:iron-sulfur cluster repair di-iron protein [Psychrobacillus sp.]|uniref:iron-sulfur cluster repair di-iron protein n=1 Tax=Psychrobacillus sp. TaxID=1871623 RepID=UPI0028BD5D9B|nr:iron-sulfur cluster repair di-iron protein [Psychrobacillus sp.]
MNQLTLESNVSDIVKQIPQTGDLFRKLRIDFCCGGKVPLQTAVLEKKLDPSEVFEKVKEIESKQFQFQDIIPTSLDEKELIHHIQTKHHAFLREELPALSPYITKISKVHGEKHPHLLRVHEIFFHLKRELLDHTEDEDNVVFPLIMQFLSKPTKENAEQLIPHVFELEQEHENAGTLLKELREITKNFTPPEGACGTYQLVYKRLEYLEKDTYEHVHLENNILFENVRNAM